MTKTVKTAVLLLATFLLFFACQKEEPKAEKGMEKEIEEVTLKVWSWLPNDHDNGPNTYAAIFSEFEKEYPHVTIELTPMPYPTFWDSWRNATIAGTGPDVISMYGGANANAYSGSLLPLQDQLSDDVISDLRFIDSSISPDGNLYVAPAGGYVYHLLVNQNHLSTVGLDAKKDFSTWDGLLEGCETLAAEGIAPFATGWSDGYALEGFMYVFLTQLLDEEGFNAWVRGELPLTDPRFKTGMQYVLEMEEANCFAEEHFGKNMYFDSFDTIIAGNAAVFFSGGADTAVSAESHNGEGSMAIIPFPQVPESEYEMISDGGPNQGWSVTTWTEHKEIALKLIEHIVSPESQQLLWDNTMLPPNSKSLKVASDDDLVNDYLEILSHPANHTTFMAFTDPALAIFQREASNLITGRTTVDQILEKADEAQARALEETE